MLRYHANQLIAFASDLFAARGIAGERAEIIATYLVDADMMGHDTHGLGLVPDYLQQIEDGHMQTEGDPTVINERGACLTLDAHYLPGVWMTAYAVEKAIAKTESFGTGIVSIRRAHHIACLGAFLPIATERGYAIMLLSSDPSETGVAPHGAVEACYTPNPIAFGYPTQRGSVLIDVSTSITTLGLSKRLTANQERYPGHWAIDANGQASDDPAVLSADPPGALLPLGGLDAGHKGFGLALMVEALTSGLAGFGRRGAPTTHGASVFVQVFDPAAFGGLQDFIDENTFLADKCRGARVPSGADATRLPGDAAGAKRRGALVDGVPLHPDIVPALRPWAQRLGVPIPEAIA